MLPAFADPTSYDEAARYLYTRYGELLLWSLRLAPDQVRFGEWLQAQLTLPGVKQRLCDGIARLIDVGRGGLPLAALLEIQTQPDARMPGRLLLAGGLVLLLLTPDRLPGSSYELAAVVINLTGKGNAARRMSLGASQLLLVPSEVNLEELDAAEILEQVVRKEVPTAILAFVPLMQGGGQVDIIQRWLEAVELLEKADPGGMSARRFFSGGGIRGGNRMPIRLAESSGGFSHGRVATGQGMEGRG